MPMIAIWEVKGVVTEQAHGTHVAVDTHVIPGTDVLQEGGRP
jgi:hypothetical protein